MRPPIDDMKTTRPRAARIIGRNAWVTATWPTTLTSSWRRSSSRLDALDRAGDDDAGVVDEPVEPPAGGLARPARRRRRSKRASATSMISGSSSPAAAATSASPSSRPADPGEDP